MNNVQRLSVAVGTALVLSASFAGAALADAAINVSEEKPLGGEAMQPIHEVTLAQQLAMYGQQNSDPMALVVAAQIMGQYQLTESTVAPRDDPGEAPADLPGAIASTSREMLAMARDLAGDRQDLIALIEDAEAAGSRGSVYGPGSYEGWVGPYNTVAYDESFYGGERAVITLNGWDNTDIDMFVYDEYGNQVCESVSYTSSEYCEFTPRWTGDFTLVIENYGGANNSFSLWTN